MEGGRVFRSRLGKLAREVDKAGLQGVIVVPGPNLRYLTGVQSLLMERPFMLFVPAKGVPHLVAPALEAGPYRGGPFELEVHDWTDSNGPSQAIKQAATQLRVKGKWGVEGRAPFLFLNRLLKHVDPRLEDAEPILQGVREVKDEAEVRVMKRAARILSDSFRQFPTMIEVGMTESELGRKVSDVIYANGGTKVDDVLVQSGPSAADPHCLPSARKIGRGESLVIDIGSTYEGYYADITRTFCLGQSKEVERVYSEVLASQEKAIAAAEEGVAVGKVDAAARNHLVKAGLGKYFIHRTGHGLGLEVHEAPYIVQAGKERLRRNMFFTVEPGVYMRGKLGVRIEDNVMIETAKALVTTDPPKEYGWWR
jgi:Xaa-Pro dipeptidase